MSTYLATPYEQLIHKSRYARWLEEEKRRETWEESVARYMHCIRTQTIKQGYVLADVEIEEITQNILTLKNLPSMRLMMTAGKAVSLENVAAYNCAYIAINHKRAFAEALYILMNGTGVGFSCERQEVAKLPAVPGEMRHSNDVIVVADSKLGWARALKKLIGSLYEGDIPKVDYSLIRPYGAPLRTFGGRASGPEPLRRLFDFLAILFKRVAAEGGRKLNSLEVHDVLCCIGETIVVGGVRRSALISLSNLSDSRMRPAKDGQWWVESPQRRMANNSVAYTEKPPVDTFMEEWLALVRSKSGERGIFNRVASQKQASKWGRRDAALAYGTNPCSEIILRNKQFCNLTTVIVRANDTLSTLKQKVRVAAILGTIQSSFTDFNFLSEEWQQNTQEERLLGVSLNGIMDHSYLAGRVSTHDGFSNKHGDLLLSDTLEILRGYARATNKEWAERLGVPASAAITCIKPEGTTSQLVNCASGIHPRHSRYYVRRVRNGKKDPLTAFLVAQGVPCEDDVMAPQSTAIFSYPIACQAASATRNDVPALEHLRLWLTYQRHWCEHKPSVTIHVKDSEWLAVGAWVFEHFDEVSGISFLPHTDHNYLQAPYEEITEQAYAEMKERMPVSIDWTKLVEESDDTKGSQEQSCAADGCEVTTL